jgi:hypothetical protein
MVALLFVAASVRSAEIRGRVADPKVNGDITFVRLVARNGPGSGRSVAVGSDGRFLLTEVPPGSYFLAAERVSGFPAEPAATAAVGALHTDAVAVQALDVEDRNLAGIEIVMAPPRDLPGTVTTEEGAECPLGRATRVLLRPEVALTSGLQEAVVANSFTVSAVAPMRNRVSVAYVGDCYVKLIKYGGREAEDSVVDLSGEGSLEIRFAMGGGVSGTVVDEGGKTPVRARVTLVPENGAESQAKSMVVAAGRAFRFRGVEPGAYRLYAWAGQAPSPEAMKELAARGTPVTVRRGDRGEAVTLTVAK